MSSEAASKKARDRGLEALRFRLDGETFKQIGDRYGISPNRAKVIVDKSARLLRQAIIGGSQEFDTPEKAFHETELADDFDHEFVADEVLYRGIEFNPWTRN